MPLMIIRTSAQVSEEKAEELLKAATKVITDLGKPESHAMVLIQKVYGSMGENPALWLSLNLKAWWA